MSATVPALLGSIALLAVGTYLFRAAGPALVGRFSLSATVDRLMSTGTVVLLTALCATTALMAGHEFVGIARPAGVIVGGVLAWRRAPFIVVVVAAAAVAALLRLAGVR